MTAVPRSDRQILTEIVEGDHLSFAQAAKRVPASGNREGTACPSTVWRWYHVGAKAPDGTVVHLEAAKVGGRWVTSLAALLRFLERLNADTPAPVVPIPARSESKRRKAVDAATKKLEAAGA